MSGGPPLIVCVLWGEHAIESVQLECMRCGVDVALDVKNQKVVVECSISPICVPCYHALGAPRPDGALLSGRLHRMGRPENN